MNAVGLGNREHTLRVIAAWLTGLRDITSPGREPVTPDRIALYAGILAEWLPSGAFTPQSMAEVVRGETYFPPVDVIRKRVGEWWSDHKPFTAPMLTYDKTSPPGWEDSDQHWLNYYAKRESERFGPVRDGAMPASRELVLSLVKANSDRAYRRIVGDDQRTA